jgi:hypothetical protein
VEFNCQLSQAIDKKNFFATQPKVKPCFRGFMKLIPISLIAIPLASFTISTPIVAEAYVQKNFPDTYLSTFTNRPIPNEKNRPNPGPRNTNPIESQIMAMSTKKALQRELASVRRNYQKWKGDSIAMKTQTRLAQIIHLRANQVGVLLQ